jgi:hypothetical protein
MIFEARPVDQIDTLQVATPPSNSTLVQSISRMVSASAASAPTEPECECQDVERCPVHFGYD